MLKKIFVNKIPKLIFIFTVLMITLIFLYSHVQKNSQPTLSEKETFDKKDLALFEDRLEMLSKVFGGEGVYWDSWNWKSNMIEADVMDVDSLNRELVLRVRRPYNQAISGKTIRSYVSCERNSTIAVPKENPVRELSGANFDIFEKVENGDMLMTYCVDEDCLNVDKLCVLVKM